MTNDQARHASAITVINLKGGVGKTHTAWLLASICQERGLKVLVIDTDTQANFTSSFLDPAQTVPGVERLFHPGAEQSPLLLVRRTAYPWIDVLPSSAALARFDLADQREWERTDLHLSLVEPIRELRPLYDYVLIDCPPRLSLVSFAALCALTSQPRKADVHERTGARRASCRSHRPSSTCSSGLIAACGCLVILCRVSSGRVRISRVI